MSHPRFVHLTVALTLLVAGAANLLWPVAVLAEEQQPPQVVAPNASGVILLDAAAAALVSESLKLEGAGDEAHLAHWQNADETARWAFTIPEPGAYHVQARYACAQDHGGRFAINIAGQTLDGRAVSTSGWDVYRTVDFGVVELKKGGEHTLTIAPREVNESLMHLRFVRLVPVDPRTSNQTPNTLTALEKAAGWQLLFDGETTSAWRGYRQEAFPEEGWVIEDDALKVLGDGGGGDIMTVRDYGDLELTLEFKVSPGANSGIIYLVTEEHDYPWQTGPEFQILDDIGYGLAPSNAHSAGSVYDLYSAPADKVVTETGGWNEALLRIKDGVVEHWLNGVLVTRYDLNSDDWKERVENSKFRPYETFGKPRRAHIALQDHGHDVWFRNIKIRDLSNPLPGEVKLFNGKDLEGWRMVWAEDAEPRGDTWRVEDGVIVCSGEPRGYIKTTRDYDNYILMLEWRWNPETRKTGNSGVLTRITGEDKVWPTCIEAQLKAGDAGDFYRIGDYPMQTAAGRSSGIRCQKRQAMENPPGEWNSYEIILDGAEVTLKVNGREVNYGWDAQVLAGPIGLQSEGTEIHFRRIRLAPIRERN